MFKFNVEKTLAGNFELMIRSQSSEIILVLNSDELLELHLKTERPPEKTEGVMA